MALSCRCAWRPSVGGGSAGRKFLGRCRRLASCDNHDPVSTTSLRCVSLQVLIKKRLTNPVHCGTLPATIGFLPRTNAGFYRKCSTEGFQSYVLRPQPTNMKTLRGPGFLDIVGGGSSVSTLTRTRAGWNCSGPAQHKDRRRNRSSCTFIPREMSKISIAIHREKGTSTHTRIPKPTIYHSSVEPYC